MTPNALQLHEVTQYVANNIGTFHAKRLQKLGELKLASVLLRKNPYLFKAKNILTAEGLVKSVLDAYLSSQEETLFGDFLEGVAVFVCGRVYGGVKPQTTLVEGIDLVFERNNKVYIVEIKSGPNWGNSSQIRRMLSNFEKAREVLQTSYPDSEIIAVNGCSYGVEPNPIQKEGAYIKLCGQDFWRFVSNNDELYTEIIEPLSHEAKIKNDEFEHAYAMIINKFTGQLLGEYCLPNGMIDWTKLVRAVSGRRSNPLQAMNSFWEI